MTAIWQQYKVYLSVLLLLAIARFVWQPLWQTKQDNWQQLQFSETARQKTQGLLTLEAEMQQTQQQMQTLLQATEKRLGRAADLTRYKLQTQQQLEQLFSQYRIQISQSSWRDGLTEDGVQTILLELRFSGKVKDYLLLLQHLQQDESLPSMVIIEQQLSNRGQSEQSMGDTLGRISFRFAALTQGES